MSQQEMLPPWGNQQPERPYNTDPREQTREQQAGYRQASSYETGYSGTDSDMDWMSRGGEKLQPARMQNITTWQWVVSAILIFALASALWSLLNVLLGSLFLVLGLVAAIIAISMFFGKTIVEPARIFTLDGQPALQIRNPAGSIQIHRGLTNTIEVSVTKHINGWFASKETETLDFVQDGSTIRIQPRSSYKWSVLGGVRNTKLDITVPEQCNIQTRGDAGSIRIEGVKGQVRAETSAGTIHIEHTTLEGPSSLRTNAGTIHAEQTNLRGQVDFHTDAGTIHFEGELDPLGSYRFDTSMGTVDVILPAHSSFALTASTDLGSVTNQFGNTIVGSAPHAHLDLKSSLGSVTVRRR